LQFPVSQLESLDEKPDALNEDKSFLLSLELQLGQLTSSWFKDDLCNTSNFALHCLHLYSNIGIKLPLDII
jgi:hypothetical protein